MGSRSSNQCSMCDREAEVICSCQTVRFCRSCFTLHRLEYPQGRHEPTSIAVQQGQDLVSSRYMFEEIKLLRKIHISETHEVHEAIVLRSGSPVVVAWKTFRFEGAYKEYQRAADRIHELAHTSLCECLAHYLDDSFQDGYRYTLVFEGAEEGDLKSEMHTRILTNRRFRESDLLLQLRKTISAFAYLQDMKVSVVHLQLSDFIRIHDCFKFGLFGDLTEIEISKNNQGLREQQKLCVQALASLFLQMGLLSVKPPQLDAKSLKKSLAALPYGADLRSILHIMFFSKLDFTELHASLSGYRVQKAGLLAVQMGSGYHVSTSAPAKVLCPRLLPSATVTFIDHDTVLIIGGSEYPSGVYQLTISTCELRQREGLKQGREWHSAVAFNSTVLVAGGRTAGVSTASTEIQLNDGTWSPAQNLTVPREAASLCRKDDTLILCGGMNVTPTQRSFLTSLEEFRDGEWRPLEMNLAVGTAFSHLRINSGEVMIMGGLTESGLSADVWRIRGQSIDWQNALPQAVSFRCAGWGEASCALAVQVGFAAKDSWYLIDLRATPISI